MHDITLKSMDEIAGFFRQGKVSPVELFEESLKKIAAWQDTVNAFIIVMTDSARSAAKDAEKRLTMGDASPLCGIPVALKDIFHSKGVPTSCGSGMMAEFIPGYDATITLRLAKAGAVLMGKVNTHEWAFGSTGDESFYGPARNPWDPGRVTGGSSSGSAAAVATGMVFAAMGSDTGGSIRTPASLCGVVGFKPTLGLTSLYGLVPLSLTMDHAGPLTRSVMDAALVMDAITGFDPADPCPARRRNGPTAFAAALRGINSLHGTTIGIPDSFFFDQVDYGVEERFQEAVRALERLGAKIAEVSMPYVENIMEVSTTIMTAEAAWVHKARLATNPGGFNPEIRARLEKGAAYPVTEYIEAMHNRNSIIESWEKTLTGVDAVAVPTTPVTACPLGARTLVTRDREEPVHPTNSRHTRLANVTGGPALSVPCGLTRDNLPAGIMFMGKVGDDLRTLRIGYAYEKDNPFSFPGR
ncbi:MAG: amidase [Planctomycetes bacterium]|nr:amidase [Planctomycetota bacterium]